MNRNRETAPHPPLEQCPDCGGPVTPCQSETAKQTRVIEDIPATIEPEVTAHEIPRSLSGSHNSVHIRVSQKPEMIGFCEDGA